MRRRILLLSLACLSGASLSAQPAPVPTVAPQPPTSPVSPTSFSAEPVALLLATFDGDGDAKVSRGEFDAGAAKTFAASGETMSLIEFSNWSIKWLGHQGALPGQFDFDSNGDDRISRAEYAAELARNFARFDRNGDGSLDRSELVSYTAPRLPPPGKGDRKRRER